MAKVLIKCIWEEETGDHWPPQYRIARKTSFTVTCACGERKSIDVEERRPDPTAIFKNQCSDAPYFVATCAKCGVSKMIYAGEGAPKQTTIILTAKAAE